MVATVANIVAGKPVSAGGGVAYGPLGTTLPTDATSPLDPAFKPAGYISEDGLTETSERSTENVRAWGGDLVKVLQTEFATTYTFTCIESINGDVLSLVHGPDNVSATTDGFRVMVKSDQLEHQTFVFTVRDGDARVRIVVPDGQVTEVGEITYNDGSVIGYPVTVSSFLATVDDEQVYAVKYISRPSTPDEGATSTQTFSFDDESDS